MVAVMLLAMLAGGCSWIQELKLPLITPEGKKIAEDSKMAEPKVFKYPGNAALAEPFDIEVIREGKGIRLDNRSTHAYQNVQLWLNQQYGADITAVPIGRGELISLHSFVNQYNEQYPTAKFLYPDNDKPLVMADLVVDGKVHKLTVRLNDDWRHP
jgi:hypothetical protein